MTECSYVENGMGPVASYTAIDPEGLGIDWDVTGTDSANFEISDDGVLTFADPPDYETPKDVEVHTGTSGDADDPQNPADNNEYVIMVRATEMRPDDDEAAAQTTPIRVVVTVTNEDEPGMVDLTRLQPQVSAGGLSANLRDPDGASGATPPVTVTLITGGVAWQWSVPKVSRPDLENDEHWQPAGATPNNQAGYTPDVTDAGKLLRVRAMYIDGEGTGMNTAYAMAAYKVRAIPLNDQGNPADNNDPEFDETAVSRTVAEDAAVGTNVGARVTAGDNDVGDILTYVLGGTDGSSFDIDKATGQITIAAMLDFEEGSGGDGEYEVTVTAYDPFNADTSIPATVTIEVTDVNEKPSVTGVAEVDDHPEKNSVDESVTYVALDNAYAPSDGDAGDDVDDLTLTLEGDDADAFELGVADSGTSARVLTFVEPPNFEAPTDANRDNVYKVTVVATDDEDLTGEQAVNIIVTNIDEAGEVTLSSVQPQAEVALTATLADPDGGETNMEWQWSSSETSGGTFAEIDGATSATYTPVGDDPATDADDGDEGKFLRVTVTYNDAQAPDDPDTADTDEAVERTLTMTSAHAVREAPETNADPVFAATITREVKEGTAADGKVGEPVGAMDADNDVLTYSLSGGADMDAFDIDSGTGQITVGEGTVLDFEGMQRTYMVEVMAADAFGASATVMVTIMVTDVDERPAFEAEDPEDYVENGMGPVATYAASDPEGLGIDWDVTGTDSANFEISDDGVLTFKNSPDYETPSDGDHPVGEDATADPANPANNNEYVIMVWAAEMRPDDDEAAAQSTPVRVVVTVTNEDEPGMVDLTRLQPQVSAGGLSASLRDPDGASGATPPVTNTAITNGTWQWSVPKVARPELENDDHWQPAGATPNNQAGYTPDVTDAGKLLRVRAMYIDGEGTGMNTAYAMAAYKVRAIPLNDQGNPADNNDPEFDETAVSRTVAEDAAVGTNVGARVTAGDTDVGDILTYVLGGTDGSSFDIDKATGQITIAAMLDFEEGSGGDGEYEVTVTAYDPFNADTSIPATVTIEVTDVNEKPSVTGVAEVDDHPEKNSVDESVTYVALDNAYAPSDGDAGDTVVDLTLTLEGDDADAFELGVADSGTGARVLTFVEPPNFEAPTDANRDNVYKVTVVATDDENLTGEQAVTIIVTNVDEAGKVTLSSIQPQAGVALTATLVDPDGGETNMEWQWSSARTDGADASFTNIEGATSATYTPVGDDPATEDVNESDEGKFLRATVTYNDAQAPDDPDTADTDEAVDRMLMATSANAVREAPETNDGPEFAATITREVKENTAAEGIVGEPVTAMDADNDVLTYSLSGGADMDAFDIDSGTGQITVGMGTVLDFEGKRTYMVEVTATDPFGGTATVMVTIMVTDVDEPPVFGEPEEPVVVPPVTPTVEVTGEATVDYEENGTEAVGTYESSEAGATWSLSGEDMDAFSISSGGVLEFTSPPDFEAQTDANTDNVYMVTVVAMAEGAEDGSLEVAVTVTNDPSDDETMPPTNGNGNGNGAFDPLSYDANENGVIDRPEVITAIRHYFDDVITRDDVLEVIKAYFGNGS